MVILNFLLGFIGFISGFYMMKEAYYLNHHLMYLKFVEDKYGHGTGTNAYQIIGIVVMVFCLFMMIGKVNVVQMAVGGPGSAQSQTKSSPAKSDSINYQIPAQSPQVAP